MKASLFLLACLAQFAAVASEDSLHWIKKEGQDFSICFTAADSSIVSTIGQDLARGHKALTDFFHAPFEKKFIVYIFPNRNELDKQWSKDWGGPNFHSQCWMVASGVADRLDMLSPLCWKREACDHNGGDSELQQIVTHELTHVFHAQHNPNPTFDGMDDLSWLAEGVATFVSGQLSEARVARVKTELKEKTPTALAELWTGKEKYGRAGCFIAFLDKR